MFLDKKLLVNNGIYETQVYMKETRIPIHRIALGRKSQKDLGF